MKNFNIDSKTKTSDVVNHLMQVRNERINDARDRLTALSILRDWLQNIESGKELNNRLKRNFDKFAQNFNLQTRIEFKTDIMNNIDICIHFNDTYESVSIGRGILDCETINIRNGVNYWLNVRSEQYKELQPDNDIKEVKKDLTKKIKKIITTYKKFNESLSEFKDGFNCLQYSIEFSNYESFYIRQIFSK